MFIYQVCKHFVILQIANILIQLMKRVDSIQYFVYYIQIVERFESVTVINTESINIKVNVVDLLRFPFT